MDAFLLGILQQQVRNRATGGGGGGGVPVIESSTVSLETSSTTSHVMDMPSTRPDGDVYVCVLLTGSTSSITPPGNWTEQFQEIMYDYQGMLSVWTWTGSSEPASYTVTTTAGNLSVGVILRISGATETPNAVSAWNNAASSNDAVAPSVTVTADDTLVVRVGCRAINNTNDAISGTPTTEIYYGDTGGTSAGNESLGLSYEDGPASGNGTGTAAFTDLGGYSQWGGLTIAFEPA